MATILENRKTEEKKPSFGNTNVFSPRSVTLVEQKPNPKATRQVSKAQSEEYEVIFASEDSNVNQKAFDFAIQAAKNFSARLVLLYLVKREEVPPEFVDFATNEGIADYESDYYSKLANEKLGNLGEKADAASVDWIIQEHFGDVKSAMKWRVGDKRTIFVLNASDKKGIISRLSRALSSNRPQKASVPVFVF